ncbi:hypothetical protein DDZ14_13660 [Maritimibacter sp. 55A14]|uniref:TetR/AcrR family transcriptional regulator n=1 Tax=Maritimibacter sp. 55A14 TaxID=2174844 RepID=UPI000D612E52|nr:hypothetical protein [Maritimibacter sp. 55A14]PWE31229.1 hypothetical protein DDZ14_13660 [Maritimibacter sp. 55A14]
MTKNTVPERRKEIVEATTRQVPKLCNGLLSTQAIANHIGITQAGLFRHVLTKKDLRIVVLTEIECRARRAWDEASRGYDPSVVRLRRILLAQIKLIEDYPAIPALLFSTGWLAAKEVVYPIHVCIMTALRLRVTEELSAAVRLEAIDTSRSIRSIWNPC